MKPLLPLLFLAALAGAHGGGVQQPRSGLIFSDRNTYSGCYHASVREGWKCIGGARPQLWMLMPLVEPLPPPFHIADYSFSSESRLVLMNDGHTVLSCKGSSPASSCELGPGETLDSLMQTVNKVMSENSKYLTDYMKTHWLGAFPPKHGKCRAKDTPLTNCKTGKIISCLRY